MTLSLDPKVNPLMYLYGLFQMKGVQTRDDPNYLGVKSIKVTELGVGRAEELIKLLRKGLPGVPATCQLSLDGRSIIDFTKDFVWDWFDWDVIEQSADKNELCAGCHEDIFQVIRTELEESKDINQPPDEAYVESYLSVLDTLVSCPECGGHFWLEATVEKRSSVKEYLLGAQANLEKDISAMIWYSPAYMGRAFKTFEEFLEDIASRATRPVALFFYQSVEEYPGDYFKVLTLGGGSPDASSREKELALQLDAFTPSVVAEYMSQRKRHLREARWGEGDKYYLTPAFFVNRPKNFADYPRHPLFTSGLLRSAVFYTVMAWLARSTQTSGDTSRFELPAGEDKTEALTIDFDGGDVRWDGRRIFDEPGWEEVLGLLIYEIGQCLGNNHFREYWSSALTEHVAGGLNAGSVFHTLEQVCATSKGLMRERKYISDLGRNAELLIFLDSAKQVIRYELTTKTIGFRKPVGTVKLGDGDKDLPLGALNALARIHLQSVTRDLDLGEQPADADSYSDLPKMHVLESKGRVLWKKLIPEELKAAYEQLREQKNLTIFIVSEDPIFPWELVMPYQPARGINQKEIKDEWWALKFNFARWITGSPYPASEIVLSGACCMTASADLPGASDEVKYLEGLCQERGVTLHRPQTRAALLGKLKDENYGIVHLAVHGQFDEKKPNESTIRLPDGRILIPDDLYGEIESAFFRNSPLVFLNACHSGRTGPTLTSIEGWAKTFIELGCGAFIGCGWEVSDTLASQFAVEFYKAFKDGKTLAEALHISRRRIYELHPNNSTWLAYYLYGNPDCRLSA